jgi:hypothetical protein
MVHPFARRCVVILTVFIVYVILIGAIAVAKDVQPQRSLDIDAVDFNTLTRAQASLVATLAAKAVSDAQGTAVKKRGYMNLVTELSRKELAKEARLAAIAQTEAAAAAAIASVKIA